LPPLQHSLPLQVHLEKQAEGKEKAKDHHQATVGGDAYGRWCAARREPLQGQVRQHFFFFLR
jgi:hypothetical protein